MASYPFREIEKKWQSYWETNKTFRAPDLPASGKPKFYVLDMFPYPSGSGLHVGHVEGYTATDIMARYKRMQGYEVLHPMGWDAFGLPAEQYAIQTGIHPRITTERNIARFRKQLKSLGFSYDWDREINTSDPAYYKWTQWIFIQLFKHGLAYIAEAPVNWCPALGTVLANEEVIDGRSERGGFPVIRKPMRQWMLRITAYADRLLDDLELVDWPESTKEMQRHWIGRSEGAEIHFPVVNLPDERITVFTTRPDTLFGATYMVLAPEHPLVDLVTTPEHREEVERYKAQAACKSDLERTELQKEKTGVFTGGYAINPATGEHIPIWIADYVLISYGTGAIMAVPAHDERDYEFARKYNLPIREVVAGGDIEQEAYTGDGILINSCTEQLCIDGLSVEEAKEAVIRWLEETGYGSRKINYRLRDWLFSRQRYWGEPIPILHGPDGEIIPVDESELPVELPPMEDFRPRPVEDPNAEPQPPLARAPESWKYVEKNGKRYMRELNTMPQWAGSCWYYLRFIDPRNPDKLVDPGKEEFWMSVDLYIGGAEHAVLHLLYARFWHKFLYDIGVVSTPEPFMKLVHQGMILGEIEYTLYLDDEGNPVSAELVDSEGRDKHTGRQYRAVKLPEDEVEKRGEDYFWKKHPHIRIDARAHKMSKSRGNVVNPDEIIERYGADALRLYEMFMGPLEAVKPWSTRGVEGTFRFLNRVWRLFIDEHSENLHPSINDRQPSREQLRILHATIRKVTEDIEGIRFNTAIAAMMGFVNAAMKWESRPRVIMEPFVKLLSPFAPHIAEELWERLGHTSTLAYEPWPTYDEQLLVEETMRIVVQVNGKVRATLEVPANSDRDTILKLAREHPNVLRHLNGKEIRREIYVPNKLVNLVVG